MAEYYVVKDKNTGLYFRGKGVNKWGKQYNQASIYRIKTNAENTAEWESRLSGVQAEVVPIHIIEATADVVEVVRCKDCVYWNKRTVNNNGFVICVASGMEIHTEDFCSYGERSETK